MRVAMIPSAYRTIFFRALAERLERMGHQVFWLSPNSRWARWLVSHRVEPSRILEITRDGKEWTSRRAPTDSELRSLQSLEAQGTLRINDIRMMDPLFVRRPPDYALKYLAVCERRVRDFLISHEIRCVTAEQTWAFELLVGQVCISLGIPHLMPHTIRIPDGRFGFFVGHKETDLLPIREPTIDDRSGATAFLSTFRERKPKPSYMAIDRRVLRPDVGRIRTLLGHLVDLVGDRYDETSYGPGGLIASHTRQLIRTAVNRRTAPFEAYIPSGRPYVFFPLHLQPEASIDVKGSPYTAQVELVRAMARTLPVTHDLFVKEHSVALKTRPRRFYGDLLRIPGVRLISPFVDAFSLIAGADLVVAVTGTAAYEAALLGQRSATIAPIFFDQIVTHPNFDPFREPLSGSLGQATPPKVSEGELITFLASLLAHSFPGTVGDAFWQPDSLQDENLTRVASGFDSAFGTLLRIAKAPR